MNRMRTRKLLVAQVCAPAPNKEAQEKQPQGLDSPPPRREKTKHQTPLHLLLGGQFDRTGLQTACCPW